MVSHNDTPIGHDAHKPTPPCSPHAFVVLLLPISPGVAMALLKGGAIPDLDTISLDTGRTPIYHAIKCGNADVALTLARAGGDINIPEFLGWNPLMCAVSDQRVKLATDLLLAGSDVNVRNEEGDSALDMAVKAGNLSMIKVLLAEARLDTRGKVNRYTKCA